MTTSIMTWNTQGRPPNNEDRRRDVNAMGRTSDVAFPQKCGGFAGTRAGGGAGRRPQQPVLHRHSCIRMGGRGSPDREFDRASGILDPAGRHGLCIHPLHVGGRRLTDHRPFMRAIATEAGDRAAVIGGDFNVSLDTGTTELNAGSSSRPVAFSVHTRERATHLGGLILDQFVSRNSGSRPGPRRYRTRALDHDAVSAGFSVARAALGQRCRAYGPRPAVFVHDATRKGFPR